MSDLGRSCMNRSLKSMEIPIQRNQEDEQRLHFDKYWPFKWEFPFLCEATFWDWLVWIAFESVRPKIYSPKNECSECPEKWKKWWHWKTILSSLKWSQFQVTGSGKTDVESDRLKVYFLLKGVFFFQAKRLDSALWVPGQMDIFMEELGAKERQASLVVGGGWLRLGALFFFFPLTLAIDKFIYIFGWTKTPKTLIVIGFLKGRRVQQRGTGNCEGFLREA